MVRAVGCECCVSELDGIRVELARGDAVDVGGRVRLIARDPEGDRVDAGRELDGFGHLLPRVIAACRIEVHVLDELLRGLTHIEDHLVVGGVVILSGVARHKRDGAALAGVNREGDGVAALVEVARVGAARRGVVAGDADNGFIQSMSRTGNCIDNGATEQVFGHLKDEFFRGQDWQTFESFKADLDAYVTHWNTQRRQVKLKGLTPAEYRDQALQQAA